MPRTSALGRRRGRTCPICDSAALGGLPALIDGRKRMIWVCPKCGFMKTIGKKR